MKPRTLFTAMLAASLLFLGAQAVGAQTKDPKTAELEKQLADAKKQLAEASKKMAELSVKLAKEQAGASKKLHSFMYINEDRPRLGVLVNTDKSPETDSKGALLEGVTPGSPADQAGLKANDIITKFNGEKLAGPYEDADEDESPPGVKFIDLAGKMKKGDKVTLEYLRGRETRTATVSPKVMEDKEWNIITPDWTPDVPDFEVNIPDIPEIKGLGKDVYWLNLPRQWLDLELVALSPELGQYFNAAEGVLVVSAPKDTSLRLRPGDVILKIGDHKVTTPSQAYRILRTYEVGETATLDIMRKQNHESLTVTVPEPPKSKIRHEEHRVPSPPEAPTPPTPPTPPAPPTTSGDNGEAA